MEISSSFRLCCAYQLLDLSYPERTSQFYPQKKKAGINCLCAHFNFSIKKKSKSSRQLMTTHSTFVAMKHMTQKSH